jgi:hypothetical protein
MMQVMGAWGEKAFQNDSALDWVAELEAGGPKALRDALSAVACAGVEDYVDVDDGSRAVAAAEVVAAAFGLREVATQAVPAWLDAHRAALVDDDRDLARRALKRVLDGPSELRGLWEQDGADSPWRAEVRSLLTALGGDADLSKAASTRQEPKRASFEQEKRALLTFLQARGLSPNAEQLARLEATIDKQEVQRWLARAASVASLEDLFDN